MHMTDKNDGSICPLCQQKNRCGVKAASRCWCMNTQVPEALLAEIPEDLKGISCVCNACIERYWIEQNLKINVE